MRSVRLSLHIPVSMILRMMTSAQGLHYDLLRERYNLTQGRMYQNSARDPDRAVTEGQIDPNRVAKIPRTCSTFLTTCKSHSWKLENLTTVKPGTTPVYFCVSICTPQTAQKI